MAVVLNSENDLRFGKHFVQGLILIKIKCCCTDQI